MSAKIGMGCIVLGGAVLLGTWGCAADTEVGGGESTSESPLALGEDHAAGSQIRLHEGRPLSESEEEASLLATVPGHDVSSHQGNVNWSTVAANGAKFVYIKATEGTSYTNPYFTQQYNGSYNAGLIRGAYHFATPNSSSGTAQANYFVDHGGGWSADGKTLPPAVDLEYNPYSGGSCYGLSTSAMVTWIRDFSNRVKARTGRNPTFYTSRAWWNLCTGSNASFGANPLWIANWSSTVGTLPAGWSKHTIWQWDDSGTFPGDQNRYNGTLDQLKAFAKNAP
ncbi:lysozyme [Pendulispora brunnea]|uniref:Lysozyme n=1 Tax=Pendulispora brunnea TaxID=2905690 RepID=A0ABZ2KF99_9BACT